MKKQLTTILMTGLLIMAMSSCARFYGFKKPIAQPDRSEWTVSKPTDNVTPAATPTEAQVQDEAITQNHMKNLF